jgi:phage baseplate assembly protein W
MPTSITWPLASSSSSVAPSGPADPYGLGIDVSTFVDGDLDPTFALISGPRVVAEAIARRLQTPRGGLVRNPDYGTDLRQWVNASLTSARRAALQNAIAGEAGADPRVDTVEVEFVESEGELRVSISGTCAAGPFDLVLDVASLTVDLLNA